MGPRQLTHETCMISSKQKFEEERLLILNKLNFIFKKLTNIILSISSLSLVLFFCNLSSVFQFQISHQLRSFLLSQFLKTKSVSI